MNDWWKSPVLQGDENDYGQYDYMIEEIPENNAEWVFDPYVRHCDCCGKYRHILFCATHYFRTLDGWDSHTYDECLLCMIEGEIHSKMRKAKKKLRAMKQAVTCIIKERGYGIKDYKWLYKLFAK